MSNTINALRSMGFENFRVIETLKSLEDVYQNFELGTKDENNMLHFSKFKGEFDWNLFQQKRHHFELDQKWKNVRKKRDELLAKTDWTQLGDVPIDRLVCCVYRQKLRDIPQNFSDPDKIEWPVL